MSDFRWGILGTGGIAQAFAADLAHAEGQVVAAVGSRTVEGAASFAQLYPTATPFGSYEELVASDVDAIYVSTPHIFHAENAALALNAGKPVLCEKAFTINAEESAKIIAIAQSKKVALMEAMWTRFLPHIQEIRKVIGDGALGEIHTVIADHGQYIPYTRAPRLWEPALGGGALLDLGIYSITIADIALGSPTKTHAHATLTDLGVDLQTSMALEYSNGAHALLTCTMAARTSVTALIAGDKARIEIDAPFYNPTSWRLITRDGEVTEFPNTYKGHGLREEAIEFARVVRSGEIESPLMTHAKSQEIMELMDEVRRQIGVKYPTE
ncbi:MviM Predicted dehydrogenases and related proteins [Candidatus Nanopelagicaceae bacterium]